MVDHVGQDPPAGFDDASGRTRVSRELIFGSLYMIAVLNGFMADIVNSVRAEPFWSAVNGTFGISVVSVAAVFCGLTLVRQSSKRPADLADLILVGIIVILLLLPHRAASWSAVTILAAYELGCPRSRSVERAGAAIFLALAASEFWAPVLIQASDSLWLSWDAALVSAVLKGLLPGGVVRTDNLVSMPDGSSIAMMVGCASLPNIAYGLLCWLVIAKGVRPTWNKWDAVAATIVTSLVMVLNVGRVTLMAIDPDRYALIHGAVGANAFNLSLLAASAAVAIWTIHYSATPVGSGLSAAGGR